MKKLLIDSKGRIKLDNLVNSRVTGFNVTKETNGNIILEPTVTVPLSEYQELWTMTIDRELAEMRQDGESYLEKGNYTERQGYTTPVVMPKSWINALEEPRSTPGCMGGGFTEDQIDELKTHIHKNFPAAFINKTEHHGRNTRYIKSRDIFDKLRRDLGITFEELKAFKFLHLDREYIISDLTPLMNFEHLEMLTLDCSDITDLSPLIYMDSLKDLVLKNFEHLHNEIINLRKKRPDLDVRSLVLHGIK